MPTVGELLRQMGREPLLFCAALLTLWGMLLNGWTDAPGAIATAVATRSLTMGQAARMAAAAELLGAAVMTRLSPKVAFILRDLADPGPRPEGSRILLCGALTGTVIWAAAAGRLGIPTSESHALTAGLTGGVVALRGNWEGVRFALWGRVLGGLVLSVVMSFAGAALFTGWIEAVCRRRSRQETDRLFRRGQAAAGFTAVFMHGAQDGQKFMGLLLFCFGGSGEGPIPLWLPLLCGGVMGLGAGLGGERTVKRMGMDLAKLRPHQGFAADAASSLTLFCCSLLGLPVSTGNAKTAAVAGAGAARRPAGVDWRVAGETAAAWILTFPGCGLLGFAAVRLLMRFAY